jgi:hypothetical protein
MTVENSHVTLAGRITIAKPKCHFEPNKMSVRTPKLCSEIPRRYALSE